jgi:hypothetical protein
MVLFRSELRYITCMRKNILLLGLLFFVTYPVIAVPEIKDSKILFFPGQRLFPSLFFDPVECQIMGGSYLLTRQGHESSLYSTVNAGFSVPVLGKKNDINQWEINFGAAEFSQFDLIRKDNGSFLAGLMNTDFKLSADGTVKINNNLLRFRVFHISSHLGDDFLKRNGNEITNDKSGNYEQIDLTWLKKYGVNYLLAGTGFVYNPYAFRKRFSLQAGGMREFSSEGVVHLFMAGDIKFLEENSYYPDVRSILGFSLYHEQLSMLRIWAECYSGRLPYSTIDYGRVTWFGLAMSLNLFRLQE